MQTTLAQPAKLPPRTLVYLLIGIGAIVLFLLLGVVPMQQGMAELDQRIEQAKFNIEEQNNLQPIYQKMLAIAQAKGAKAPPLPPRKGLGQDQVGRVTDTLTQLIVVSGLEAVAVVPDPSSLDKGSKALAVTLQVKGDMERFRAFLGQLAALPSFENLETVQVAAAPKGRDFKVKAWLATE